MKLWSTWHSKTKLARYGLAFRENSLLIFLLAEGPFSTHIARQSSPLSAELLLKGLSVLLQCHSMPPFHTFPVKSQDPAHVGSRTHDKIPSHACIIPRGVTLEWERASSALFM